MIAQPLRWWDMVSPTPEEMVQLIRAYQTKQWWRIPRRCWEDMWRLKRGHMNHMLGPRNFKLPKYQRGSVSVHVNVNPTPAAGGTNPSMKNITHTRTTTAPNPARIQIGWDSDGSVRHYFGGTVASVVWADLTTQTDDTNDHTNDWWPDQPDTNEGLNWDIRSTSETNVPYWRFHDGTADRTVNTWYLLDTVSNDMADASKNGCIVCLDIGGTAKNPVSGTDLVDCTIEIRATGTGSAVASSVLDLQCDT